MNRKKLDKLKREVIRLRRSPQKALAIQGLARALGRKLIKRGKEPNWESQVFPQLFPLSIPDHGGRDLAIGTKNSILDQLEDDILAWDDLIGEDEDDETEDDQQEDDRKGGESDDTG